MGRKTTPNYLFCPASRRYLNNSTPVLTVSFGLIVLGLTAGCGAGLLAGLIGIGGGIVVVPVVYYGLMHSGVSMDMAAHIAVATSLAAIMPTAIVLFYTHLRAGNTDWRFCAIGVRR